MPNKSKANQLTDAPASLVMIKGETWKCVSQLLQLLDATFDPRVFVTKQKSDGKQISLRGAEEFMQAVSGGAPAVDCPLGNLKRDTANSTEQVAKYLIAPGYVHYGGESILLEKDDITPTAGQKLYIEVDFTANISNGVLLGSGMMNAAEIKQGASVPADDELSVGSPSGKHRRVLGEWIDSGAGNNNEVVWVKDGCGGYTVSFCRVFTGYRGSSDLGGFGLGDWSF